MNDDSSSSPSKDEQNLLVMTRKQVEYDDEKTNDRIEDYDCYRLDYEDDDNNNNKKESRKGISRNNPTQQREETETADEEAFQPGDHVYMWCTLYQHHGIVLEVYPESPLNDDDNNKTDCHPNDVPDDTKPPTRKPSMLIAEFTNAALAETTGGGDAATDGGIFNSWISSTSTASGAVTTGVAGGFRLIVENQHCDDDTDKPKWHRVVYKANPLQMASWRPGTCSSAIPSDRETILRRVAFLRDCHHNLPPYHVLESNCETVAVWCRTGQWQTLQGDRALYVASALSLAIGPPVIGALLAGGLTLWQSSQLNSKWKDTAQHLNQQFEWYSLGKLKPTNFAFEATAAHAS